MAGITAENRLVRLFPVRSGWSPMTSSSASGNGSSPLGEGATTTARRAIASSSTRSPVTLNRRRPANAAGPPAWRLLARQPVHGLGAMEQTRLTQGNTHPLRQTASSLEIKPTPERRLDARQADQAAANAAARTALNSTPRKISVRSDYVEDPAFDFYYHCEYQAAMVRSRSGSSGG